MLHQSQKQLRSALRAFALAASLPLVLTGCQDEEFGYSADEIKYERNFTDKYGEIAPDKNWDLSTYGTHYGDEAGAGTRAAGQPGDKLYGYYDAATQDENMQFVKKGWWEVPKNTLKWMEKALAEGKDNRYLGSNFILQLPANDFAIVPIFQGHSGINSELEVKINGYQITKVWGRSEDILVNDRTMTETQAANLPGANAITAADIKSDNNTYDSTTGEYKPDGKWHTLGYYSGVTNPSQADQETGGRGVEYNDGITEHVYPTYPCWMEWAHRVMSKPIYFRKDKIDTGNPYMYLSLHNIGKQVIDHKDGVERIWDYNIWLDERGPNVWTKVGNRLTSINPAKRMLALNIPTADRPNKDALPKIHEGQGDNYREPSQVMIIACEDADGVASDNDVNDVAFLIIGYPNVPTVIPTEEVIKKRYMCEDLGATDDFDFNDIVIDVTQTMQYQLVTTPAGMEDYDFNDQFNGDNVTGVEIASMQPLDGKNGTTDTRKQTAKITHVCGTLPITARVGNYIFPKIADPTDQYATRCALRGDGAMAKGSASAPTRAAGDKIGWNPNEEKVIPDNSWDPEANNITIYVDWSKSGWPAKKNSINAGKVDNTNNPYAEGTSNFADFAEGNKVWVSFPRPGEVPYIIATDQDVPWMLERQDIPAEWVDSRADITARNNNEADPGYGMYMENYGIDGARQEIAIWSGNVTGLGGTTGVVMEPGSPEILGIAAAGEGYTDPDELATGTKQTEKHYAHKLIVYTEPMNGQIGAINLCYNDNGEWIPLTTQQPDGYSQGPVESSTYGFGTAGLCRTEIYLTNEQYVKIVGENGAGHGFDGKGLVVVSQTNGLVIRKISMEVARTYNQGPYYGYLVNIEKPINASGEGNGTIKAIDQFDRRFTKQDSEAETNTENSRVSVPFEQLRFDSGDSFTLTAIGKAGYALKNWVVKDEENNTTDTSIKEAQHTFTCNDGDSHRRTISAVFEVALDPALVFQPGETKSIDITIEKGQTYVQKLTSLYWSTKVDYYGENGDVVTLTTPDNANLDVNGVTKYCHCLSIYGKEVGTTEFVVYTRDGYLENNETKEHFGVSDELKVKVKVVEPVAEEVELRSATHFYKWDKMAADAKVVSRGTTQDILNTEVEASDKGFALPMIGCSDNDDLTYADLNNSDYITIYVAAGYDQPLLFFNVANNADKVDFLANDNRYCTAINIDDGSMKYVIDLKKVRGEHGYYSVLKFIGTDWGKSCKITDVRLDKYNSAGADAFEEDQRTMCGVGVNMDQNVGKVTITTDGIFYTKNDDGTYSTMAEKSIQCNTPNAVYVKKNTVVTFTAPQNADYIWGGWSNGSKDYTRTGAVDNVSYNPYLTYTLKDDPELALTDPSQATIVLDYATPYVDIKWSKASGSGDVKFKGYDYATEVNIWRNGEENSHHMRAQETNFNNKKITMYVDATDTHRSASIELDVTVKDYVDNNYGYRVPATGNEVLARMIKDALHNTTKNIQIMVRRGTSVPATIKVKNATGEWDKTLKDNGTWTSDVASYNDTWEGQDAISFTFTISASDFSTYFKEWESKLVFYGFDGWNGINDGGENQRGVWVKAVD